MFTLMKIESEHEGFVWMQRGGAGRLIVRDALAKGHSSLPWFARRAAPWTPRGADIIERDARDEGCVTRRKGHRD
jgi:hypothetical protein